MVGSLPNKYGYACAEQALGRLRMNCHSMDGSTTGSPDNRSFSYAVTQRSRARSNPEQRFGTRQLELDDKKTPVDKVTCEGWTRLTGPEKQLAPIHVHSTAVEKRN
jgi:hypothetical protein